MDDKIPKEQRWIDFPFHNKTTDICITKYDIWADKHLPYHQVRIDSVSCVNYDSGELPGITFVYDHKLHFLTVEEFLKSFTPVKLNSISPFRVKPIHGELVAEWDGD